MELKMEQNFDVLDKEKIFEFLNEYEKMCKSMKKQLDFYEVEHESLKNNIKKLVHENNALSKSYEELLNSKLDKSESKDKIDNTIVQNLKQQIKISIQVFENKNEKDITFDLWQNSLKIIENLEDELKYYRNIPSEKIEVKTELDEIKQKHLEEIQNLQQQMTNALNQIETKNEPKQLPEGQVNLELKEHELHLLLENQKKSLEQIHERDAEIKELKLRLNYVLDSCKKYEIIIEEKDKLIRNSKIINEESRRKVVESILVTEAALAEQNESIRRELLAKKEIEDLTRSLSDLIKESDTKIKSEIQIIKETYNENINKIKNELMEQQKNLNEKDIKLEKSTRECKILEEDIERMKKGNINFDESNTTKLLMLEKNLESTFQKLLLSERRYYQIQAERDSIRIDLEQLIQTAERDRKTYEVEKQSLERKIKTLQNELSISNGYVEEYVVQIKDLNRKVIELEEEMKKKIERKQRLFDEILNEKITSIKKEHILIQNEFNKQLKSEHNLNKRWKTETKDITSKLQDRIIKLKLENDELRYLVENYQKNLDA